MTAGALAGPGGANDAADTGVGAAPREDVVAPLQPSDTITACPYKGQAGYFSVSMDGGEDLIWCYENPRAEAGAIAGRLCFWNERVGLEVDGVAQERPRSASAR